MLNTQHPPYAEIYFFLSLFTYFNVVAQEPITTQQLSLNVLMPSIEWELPSTQNTSVVLELGTGFAYAKNWSGEAFGAYPVVSSEYRYYYNFLRRQERGRKVTDNSGNYLAALLKFRSGKPFIGELEISDDYALTLGPVWGMQRVYNSGFKLNLYGGAGYSRNGLGDSYLSPILGLELGWMLFRN